MRSPSLSFGLMLIAIANRFVVDPVHFGANWK
jgi:hypothetical protein